MGVFEKIIEDDENKSCSLTQSQKSSVIAGCAPPPLSSPPRGLLTHLIDHTYTYIVPAISKKTSKQTGVAKIHWTNSSSHVPSAMCPLREPKVIISKKEIIVPSLSCSSCPICVNALKCSSHTHACLSHRTSKSSQIGSGNSSDLVSSQLLPPTRSTASGCRCRVHEQRPFPLPPAFIAPIAPLLPSLLPSFSVPAFDLHVDHPIAVSSASASLTAGGTVVEVFVVGGFGRHTTVLGRWARIAVVFDPA